LYLSHSKDINRKKEKILGLDSNQVYIFHSTSFVDFRFVFEISWLCPQSIPTTWTGIFRPEYENLAYLTAFLT